MKRPYRLFDVTLLHSARLSPSLCRFTFGGADVVNMRTCAPDQRIKVFFPDAAGKPPSLSPDTWLADYQAMRSADRPPRRTYTIRGLRSSDCEVDIDFVLHGSTGPASRWALSAVPGDKLQIVAPDATYAGDPGGYEWRPPAQLDRLLLLADETALPAVAGILEDLACTARPPTTLVHLEVPTVGDCLALPTWPSLRLHWAVREGSPCAVGDFLIDAARTAEAIPSVRTSSAGASLADVDVDRTILWETQAPPQDGGFYAWVAAEAGAVKNIRRLLLEERGLPRSATNLMGYWRLGQVRD
ncbi:siderophore-interacting protein [Reyranella sp.]|uniref:siderophore-interacting protein n=1 Tax=Reyranella sp. TaxID=1929291 RepID=UPI003783BFFC